MQQDSENEIIDQVKAGDTDAFESLVRQYQTALFRIVGNLVKGPAAEDLVQDVFLAAFANLRKFDPAKGSFQTWIYRIARNHALNAIKKKRELLLDEEPVIVDQHTADRELMVKQAYQRLDRTLDQLPFDEKLIFVLAEFEGLAYADIARILELPLGTVKSKLFRVREKLRRELENALE